MCGVLGQPKKLNCMPAIEAIGDLGGLLRVMGGGWERANRVRNKRRVCSFGCSA